MSDVLWRSHPSVRAHAGSLLPSALLAVLLGSGRWWLPMLAVRLALPDSWLPLISQVSAWMPVMLLIPVVQILHRWAESRMITYELTSERLLVTTGVLTSRVDNLELYRVRDIHLELSLIGRLMGYGDIILDTVDHTSPQVVLSGIRNAHQAFDQIRDLVEACRRRAGIPGMS